MKVEEKRLTATLFDRDVSLRQFRIWSQFYTVHLDIMSNEAQKLVKKTQTHK